METHLIRSIHIRPFVDELKKRKTDVHNLVKQVGLPLEALSDDDAVVGEFAVWRLVDEAAKLVDDPHFGYACAESSPIIELASIGIGNDDSLDLLSLLRAFILRTKQESTSCYYSLVPSDSYHTQLCRLPAFGEKVPSWQVEQYILAVFIQTIRLCGPANWLPSAVSVYSSKEPQPIPDEWQSINFNWGAKATQLTIENQLLTLPPRENDSSKGVVKESDDLTFKQLIASHVRMNHANLNQLSTELGVSTATLKRRLSHQEASFTDMVAQEKHVWACELLSMTLLTINQISTKLGYNHISNFTRAFKKLSGETPMSYRKQNNTISINS